MGPVSGSILFGIIMVSALASVVPIATTQDVEEDSMAVLSEAVLNMTKADAEMKTQLMETTNALINSQNILQKLLRSGKPLSGSSEGGEPDEGLKQFASQVVTALREVGPQSSAGNSSQLADILTELKTLNSHFKNHLTMLSCPPPFVKLGSECFSVILDDLPWEEARSQCLRMGADLAQPDDLTQLRLYVGVRYPRKKRRNFWIGGVNREKVWQWLSGDALGDNHWYTNEPSGNGECLAMFDGWENPLTDFPCENGRRAICERALQN